MAKKIVSEAQDLDTQVNHGLFGDPEVQESIRKDPVIQFAKKNQSKLLTVLVVIVAFFFLKQWYTENRLQLKMEDSQRFDELRETYEKWTTQRQDLKSLDATKEDDKKKLEEEIEIEKRKFDGKVDAVLEGQEPYKTLGKVYQVLALSELGQITDLEALLTTLGSLQSQSDSEEVSFVKLAIAKALLNNSEKFESGVKILKSLAESETYIAVPALVTLSRLELSADEKAQVLKIVEGFTQKHPEQTELLEPYVNLLK